MGTLHSLVPYLQHRREIDVVIDGRWTLLRCDSQETALGPRQVLSVLDALRDAKERGTGYQTAAGGLIISGDPEAVWIQDALGRWTAPVTGRQLGRLIAALKRRAEQLQGGKAVARA